ncbi:MAG TPA: hypothetical protein VK421_16135 [Pyrinomonadaceae bacterium]|nr:hypothetical protein [Pyrinomonadaceae bacterium]
MRRLLIAAPLSLALLAGVVRSPALADSGPRGTEGNRPESSWQQESRRPVRYEPFEVEVLVGGVPLEKYPARGRLYVEALRGEEYAIRVRNPLPVRVAVALSVDGLNSIDARRSTAWDSSKWVIQPYGTITISGWQVSRARARRFYFTDERDSYANKLGRPEDIGLISAVFFRERASYSDVTPRPPRPYPLGTPRAEGGEGKESSTQQSLPQSSPPARAENRAQSGSRDVAPADEDYAATGMGRSVGHDVRFVNLDLERSPSAEVVIRYEYRPALVRLGILPRPHTARDALRRRERARGFEDGRFSPEP